MSSGYRNQRRQGVVYGPGGPQGGGGGTALLGTLLGVLVVLVAMALLAVGAFALIGDLTGGPSSSPSQNAGASSSPGASQPAGSSTVPAPSESPSAPPSESPGVQPTPSGGPATPSPPSTFVPQVQEGPGYVTFGTKTNSRLRVTDPRARFSSNDPRVVWSAYLTSPADAADLHIEIFKLDPSAADGKRLLWDHQLTIHAKGAQIYESYLRTHTALDGAGVYEVQYLRGEELLADGFFEFTG
jgi:hypothetical protein